MNWSKAERQYQARVAEAERRRRKAEAAQAAAEAKRLRDAQTIQRHITQFLEAMRQAGNPGMLHHSFWNWLNGKGYWTLHPVTKGRGKPINSANWVCSDGTFECNHANPLSDFSSYIDKSNEVKAVVHMLTEILHCHNVAVPED